MLSADRQHLAPIKSMDEAGQVTTIGSGIATRAAFPGASDYAATKAGVVGFIRCAECDLAPRYITINVEQSRHNRRERQRFRFLPVFGVLLGGNTNRLFYFDFRVAAH